MSADLAPLLDRIRLLVEEPVGAPERLLEQMEHTLTDGYALALALEGQSLRIEKDIARALALVKEGGGSHGLEEMADRLAQTERELRGLRAHLASLRIVTENVRVAALAAGV